MIKLNLSPKIKNTLDNFIQKLQDIYHDDLTSIILYGSAASGEFVDKHSNLNVLIILKNTGLEELKKSTKIVSKFSIINPLFLTENYIATSLDIFPIEFLDMQENYHVVYGIDILKDIHVDTQNLRFQCEQELKSKLINLRQLYLRINKDKSALRSLLFKSFTSVVHILRNVLRLKDKKAPYKKEDILKDLAVDLSIDIKIWQKILSAKNKELKLNNRDIDELFSDFIKELEKIVDIVDKL